MEENILEFRNVTGSGRKFHLKNVSFTINPGFIYGLMGENGAGKTTLMNYILNEHSRYKGKIFLKGEDVKKNHVKKMNSIGFVSEENIFFEERTVVENVELLHAFYDTFDMDLFLKMTKKMQISITKIYGKMSRGERMKFQLAFAIAHAPCLYLLDEVTAGMDPVFRMDFFAILQELIRDETCSVLMTTHIQSEVEKRIDYVGIIKDGVLQDFVESMDYGRAYKDA